MKRNSAQAIIEYVTLAAFVVTAILVVGPYTIRAINSYFRSSDEAMKDSVDENYRQGQEPSRVPPGCVCDSNYAQGQCGQGGCKGYERLYTRECTPALCSSQQHCSNSGQAQTDLESCCTLTPGPCWGIPGVLLCPGAARAIRVSGCPDYVQDHGEYFCKPDPLCEVICVPVKDPNSQWCPEAFNGLSPGNGFTKYVNWGQCTGALCEAACEIPFIPSADGTSCGCPEGYHPYNENSCPDGYTEQSGYCTASGVYVEPVIPISNSVPTPVPTAVPTPVLTPVPTEEPTPEPTPVPTEEPTPVPTPVPTEEPTPVPTEEPTPVPTEEPTPVPTEEPIPVPTEEPIPVPIEVPTESPTEAPTPVPSPSTAPSPS